MAAKVTIKTIAADLGVSHMTVSRVLSNRTNVRPELRDKILHRAEELGYVRNAAALAMRGDSTQSVGLLVPNIHNEFYAHFADALTSLCNAQGINLFLHLTHDDIKKEERALTLLKEAQAQTVIMVPAPAPKDYRSTHIKGLRAAQFIRTRLEQEVTETLLINEDNAFNQAVSHLRQQGHTKIAYIGADQKLASGYRRYQSFLNALKSNDIPPIEDIIFSCTPSKKSGYECATKLLSDDVKAGALICGGFNLSIGAINAIFQKDGHFPDGFGFVGYGDPSFYKWLGGGISTISLPMEALAQRALEYIKNSNTPGSASKNLSKPEANFVLRNSC